MKLLRDIIGSLRSWWMTSSVRQLLHRIMDTHGYTGLDWSVQTIPQGRLGMAFWAVSRHSHERNTYLCMHMRSWICIYKNTSLIRCQAITWQMTIYWPTDPQGHLIKLRIFQLKTMYLKWSLQDANHCVQDSMCQRERLCRPSCISNSWVNAEKCSNFRAIRHVPVPSLTYSWPLVTSWVKVPPRQSCPDDKRNIKTTRLSFHDLSRQSYCFTTTSYNV